jgi:hypothetical protein
LGASLSSTRADMVGKEYMFRLKRVCRPLR